MIITIIGMTVVPNIIIIITTEIVAPTIATQSGSRSNNCGGSS